MKRACCYPTSFVVFCLMAGAATPGVGQEGASRQERPQTSPDLKFIPSAEERALLADVKDGKFTKHSFAEAALLASGVAEAAKRKAYLQRLDALVTQSKEATANARTPIEKGEKLLGWLYGKTGPIGPVGPGKKKKYSPRQTSLAVLLDTGTYNCASSAVIYNIVGRRLGLDLRAIESPSHVFPILHDGKEHVDVETTTPRGFNPLRDKAAQKEFEELTGFTYIPARQRKKQREIDEAGLVAVIYYNRGVESGRENRNREAFGVNICALSLDPGLASAANNARAALADWAGEAVRAEKFDLADDIIRQNVEWLKDPKAEAKLMMAAYDSQGRRLRKDKNWPGMANFYAKAFKRHRGNAELAKHFENNALAAYDDWAKPFRKSGKWPEAIKVYEQGLKDLGDHKHLQQQLKYCERKRDQ